MKTVRLVAPAKINLFLGIGARREDGYHDAITVMHALAMHDTIAMSLFEEGEHTVIMEPVDEAQPVRQVEIGVPSGSGLAVHAKMLWQAGLDKADVSDEDNLACKAVRMLAQALERTEDEQVRLVVTKQIPQQAGLGGGSSDAAAALVGAAHLWGVDAEDERVLQVARSLGVDVAFFLRGGCALLVGRGDKLERELAPRRDYLVLAKPAGGVSTAAAYEAFDAAPLEVPDAMRERVLAASCAGDVPLFNNLTAAAESLHEDLAGVREFLEASEGVQGALLCGSGAATCAICSDYQAAQALAAATQARGCWSRITSFSSLRACTLPSK